MKNKDNFDKPFDMNKPELNNSNIENYEKIMAEKTFGLPYSLPQIVQWTKPGDYFEKFSLYPEKSTSNSSTHTKAIDKKQ